MAAGLFLLTVVAVWYFAAGEYNAWDRERKRRKKILDDMWRFPDDKSKRK